jgi:hypothetical protein
MVIMSEEGEMCGLMKNCPCTLCMWYEHKYGEHEEQA